MRDLLQLFSSMIDGDRCFQMLGFDIFLDKNCKPYIIEINHNPSFKLPTPLDIEIKTAALAGCLGIVCDKYMPYPVDMPAKKSANAIPSESSTENNDMSHERFSSLDSAGSESEAAMASAVERDREALFRNTGLGKRQQQQQESFAPSSFTRARSAGSTAEVDGISRIPSVCQDADGALIISSRQWSLETLYDCVGLPTTALQVCACVCKLLLTY